MKIVLGLGKMIRLDTLSRENRAKSKSDYFARGKMLGFLPLRTHIRLNVRVPIGIR